MLSLSPGVAGAGVQQIPQQTAPQAAPQPPPPPQPLPISQAAAAAAATSASYPGILLHFL